jgi:hypothetical protein
MLSIAAAASSASSNSTNLKDWIEELIIGKDSPESSMLACFVVHRDGDANDFAERDERQCKDLLGDFTSKPSDVDCSLSIVWEIRRKCHVEKELIERAKIFEIFLPSVRMFSLWMFSFVLSRFFG